MSDSLTYKEDSYIKSLLPEYFLSLGSLLYRKEIVNDFDFLITKKTVSEVRKYLESKFPVVWKESKGKESRYDYYPVIDNKKLIFNFWFCDSVYKPFYILAYGYPSYFSIAMKNKAKKQGYTLNQYGLFKDDTRLPLNSTKEVFKFLGIKYRSPHEEYMKTKDLIK